MSGQEAVPASRPDEDNPEWTREDFRTARPAIEAIGEIFGPKAAETIRLRASRPVKAGREVNQAPDPRKA